MSEIAFKVENISKKYNILHNEKSQDSSLIGAFAGGIKNFLSAKSGQSHEDFWALKDISFEISKGDRVGIIGRNGAGKSTLLKILSRIVKPTTGRIEYEGRMASLLEVGTGFHGDLSGRENIYLNGSILGMRKREIDAKFDEIVAFSEVEKFIDTPVKRYSSGMYVRLAFAVAAHLDPEILIVDEVLAVGDAAFQRKSIGKMEESSQKDGKTVLFVSHNMGQISSLCNKGILLDQGRIEMQGNVQSIIGEYFKTEATRDIADFVYNEEPEKGFQIRRITILNTKNEPAKTFAHDESIRLAIEIQKHKFITDVLLSVFFTDMLDRRLFTTQIPVSEKLRDTDSLLCYLTLPPSVLMPNSYNFSVGVHVPNIQVIDEKKNVTSIDIYDNGSEFYKYTGVDIGTFFMNGEWVFKK